jgi:hypothetical protein
VCRQPVAADGAHRPFCSERCRLVDLGRWLGGDYRVPGAADDDEDGTALTPEPPEE